MKPFTVVIAFAWLLIGVATLVLAWRGAPMPLSLKFFAVLQIVGAVLLLLRQPLGWVILITMSVFTMVSGLFALISVPFLPAETLQRAPRLGGLNPRWLAATVALLVFLFGRLCWLHLRRDAPTHWRAE